MEALELRERRVLVGHTPALRPDPAEPGGRPRPIGLVTQLRRRGAALSWVTEMTVAGHEVMVLTLPEGQDPASWLELRGAEGLEAFDRKGCLEAAPGEVRPVHAGRFLAEALAREGRSLDRLRPLLARAGACLDGGAARRRVADQAGRGLAQAGLGPDGWLGRTVAADIACARNGSAPTCPSNSSGVPL